MGQCLLEIELRDIVAAHVVVHPAEVLLRVGDVDAEGVGVLFEEDLAMVEGLEEILLGPVVIADLVVEVGETVERHAEVVAIGVGVLLEQRLAELHGLPEIVEGLGVVVDGGVEVAHVVERIGIALAVGLGLLGVEQGEMLGRLEVAALGLGVVVGVEIEAAEAVERHGHAPVIFLGADVLEALDAPERLEIVVTRRMAILEREVDVADVALGGRELVAVAQGVVVAQQRADGKGAIEVVEGLVVVVHHHADAAQAVEGDGLLADVALAVVEAAQPVALGLAEVLLLEAERGVVAQCLEVGGVGQGVLLEQTGHTGIAVGAAGQTEGGNLALEARLEVGDGECLTGTAFVHLATRIVELEHGLACIVELLADVESVVGADGLVDMAGFDHGDDALLLVRDLAEVDAHKLLDVGVEVLEGVVVAVLEVEHLLAVFVLTELALVLELLELALGLLVLLLVVVGRRFGDLRAKLGEVVGAHHDDLEHLVMTRDVPLLEGGGVEDFVAGLLDAAHGDAVAGLEGGESEGEGAVGCRHGRTGIAHLDLHTGEGRLLLLLVVLAYDAGLGGLRPGGQV